MKVIADSRWHGVTGDRLDFGIRVIAIEAKGWKRLQTLSVSMLTLDEWNGLVRGETVDISWLKEDDLIAKFDR
jgi:hypothetical protein